MVFILATPVWALRPNPDGNPSNTDVLLWHMDNPTGSTWTDSASGTMPGAGSATTVPGLFVDGTATGLGAAKNFPDGGIVSPSFPSTKGHEFTFECWVYWPTGANPQAANQLIAERRSTNMIWYLKANVMSTGGAPDTLEWAAWTSPTNTTVNSGPCNFQNNVWYHIAVTCEHIATDDNTIKIYCTPAPAPGALIGPPVLKVTRTGVHDMAATTGTNFKVGGGGTGGMAGRNFDGYIDEVRVSNVALTSFDSFLPDPGDAVYDVHSLSESQLMDLYVAMLIDGARYSDASWHTYSVGGYWGDGSTDGNSGIRAVACMILTCGTLLKYCDSLAPVDRANFLTKSIDALRFVTATHVTGTDYCTDGKKWGNAWGSAYCTGIFGLGARLIWDDLDTGLKADLERVIGYEADRFLTVNPPGGSWGDTKAEENAWNQYGISAAAYLFPANPHAVAWNDKSIQYAMNTLSVAQDELDYAVVDGKTVSEWVCTENLHPDFTLENHSIFHPSYMQCSTYLLFPAMMHCILSGQPVPQGLRYHTLDIWGVFKTLLLPSGETIFPQGMDWEMHNLPAINLFGTLATYFNDPVAAKAEKTILQYMRAWQQWQGGSLTVPGSAWGFTRHSIQCEQTATAYLAHKLFGPATTDAAPAPPEFIQYYSYVDILLHRTADKLLSFSWKNNKVMGMLTPIASENEGDPFFTVPLTNGLVGSTVLSTGGTSTSVLGRAWRTIPNGCETSGVLLRNGGLLKQELKVTSLGEKTVVYQDRVSALSSVTVTKEQGVPIGIENDSITGGSRVVFHRDGQTVFDWKSPQPAAVLPGNWANVDGRLGIVTASGSGITYSQATGYTSGIAVYTDVLYGSYSTASQSFNTGDQVARRIIVLFAEVTPEETSILSQSVRIEETPGGQVLRFSLPEGGEGEVSLSLTIPAVTPDTVVLPILATQQFTYDSQSLPVTWQVVNESVPGVGTIDSSGLFTALGLGTCQVRATDGEGYTDDSGIITVANPVISPSNSLRVVRWNTVAFSFSPSFGSVTWQVINESGAPGTVGTIDPSGLFTGVGAGTCQVRATDGAGHIGTSGLITVVPAGAYNYAADADTLALYHLDEAAGNTWLDCSGNGFHAYTANTAYPVTHTAGILGNAAGEFRWDKTTEPRWLQAGPTTLLQTDEMTAEAWVYFPAGVDIPASTGPIHGILSHRGVGNSWSMTAGVWDTTLGYGVPGGLTFVFWGTPASEFIWSPQQVFYNEVWYHVAVTVKKLNTNPVTYEVKLYATPHGTTTPQLVASKITSNRMITNSQYLYIGTEGGSSARKFPGYIDEVRISNKARTAEELKWSLGSLIAPSWGIGEAKRDLGDGALVNVTGVITAGFADCCYLQALDRSAGIKLDTRQFLLLNPGDVQTVVGKLGTVNGERYLQPLHAEKLGVFVP